MREGVAGEGEGALEGRTNEGEAGRALEERREKVVIDCMLVRLGGRGRSLAMGDY